MALAINMPATYLFLELASGFVISREGHMQEGLAMVNTSHAIVISGLGLGIKFTKNWYQQQKENAKLSRQKIAAELQLAKAKVYPRFLFQSLERLRSYIKAGSDEGPALLLRISDLLSYILYESREAEVPLQLELEMLQKRIEVENASRNGQLKIEFYLVGNSANKQIAPLASFAFLEECIKGLEKEDRNNLNVILEVNIESRLQLRLSYGRSANDGDATLYSTSIPVQNDKDARISTENKYASYERL
jgi:LytS/YehU family sensor histidine kinase